MYNISGISTWERNILAIYRFIFEFAYEVRDLHHFENRRSRILSHATFYISNFCVQLLNSSCSLFLEVQ